MSAAETGMVLLLPGADRLRGGLVAAPSLSRLLARADRLATADAGRHPQLLRHFDVVPRRIAAGPVTRALDADDAAFGGWLRADPAHLRADLASGRMLACGDLDLTGDEVDRLLKPLRPLFGDEGFPISAPVPHRWYLALPGDVRLPPMSEPADALGDDLNRHMPAGDEGRRWRRLLSEAQVLLHNHPLNAERIAAGKLPVNSVWFWGGGTLPDQVRITAQVFSDDPLLDGLCRLAGARCRPLAELLDRAPDGPALIDLRVLRDVAQLESPWLPWALEQLQSRGTGSIRFDFADGNAWCYRSSHRWRLWRRGPGPAGPVGR